MGMLEELTEAVNGLKNEVEALPNRVNLKVEHHLSSYDNGAFALPERAVRALESIADSLSRGSTMNGNCKNCNRQIDIMIFRNEDYCSELCRKALVTVQAATVNGGSKNGTKRR